MNVSRATCAGVRVGGIAGDAEDEDLYPKASIAGGLETGGPALVAGVRFIR